jgi:hypothetical protein
MDTKMIPDAYVADYGVEVTQEKHYPQYGLVNIKVPHNSKQSTYLRLSLKQAKEMYEKLGQVIEELGGV